MAFHPIGGRNAVLSAIITDLVKVFQPLIADLIDVGLDDAQQLAQVGGGYVGPPGGKDGLPSSIQK
ncbi:MAG: hypothetical protein IJU12_03700 [Clostridia bacterium]|nr:hypothetical protein [Clostridia bacterium]